jgi:sugar lactone lactonase YvrE
MRTSIKFGAALTLAIGLVPLWVRADARYEFRVVASGLDRPTGIASDGHRMLYFTEIPTPGVPGGANRVSSFDLRTGITTELHRGEPEPINIAVDRDGDLYWTCKTAGVILHRTDAGVTSVLAAGLRSPSGISVGRQGTVYFTEVPMPGVGGGSNDVAVLGASGKTVLHTGEPEPVDIAVGRNGTLYWTCRTAGVILVRRHGETSVLVSGLDHPNGLALDRDGESLYFTEVPTPGVAGSAGGRNRVSMLDLDHLRVSVIHRGDPEPTDVTVADDGRVYWTCSSAGVIVEAKPTHGRY